MHDGVRAARDMNANTRMVAATATLAERFGLSPGYVQEVQTQTGDPQVRMMKQREAVANLLDALVAKTAEAELVASPPVAPLLDALDSLDEIKGVGLPLKAKIRTHVLEQVGHLFTWEEKAQAPEPEETE